MLGQFRFLPLVQALALSIFLLVPLRRRDLRSALFVIFLWLALSMATVFALTWFDAAWTDACLRERLQLPRGLCRMVLRRQRGVQGRLPASFVTQPLASVVELLGFVLGSLLTVGFVGAWFLMKVANLAAFGAATLASTLPNPFLAVVALPLWSILQVIRGGGLLCCWPSPWLPAALGPGCANSAAAGACRCWSLAVCLCSAFCWNWCCRPFGILRPSHRSRGRT